MTELEKIKKLLQYTTTSDKTYNGVNYSYGYHTLKIDNETLNGQRNPSNRLSTVDYDFTGKNILDIGSNQGGMLFEVSNKISYGMGVDFDTKLVNVANRISKYNNYNIDFYHFDLEKENLNLLNNLSRVNKFDVVFLLAVCMWIKNWREVVLWVKDNSNYCLFETNGNKKQQEEQINFLKSTFKEVTMLSEKSSDDPNMKKRKLLWCKK